MITETHLEREQRNKEAKQPKDNRPVAKLDKDEKLSVHVASRKTGKGHKENLPKPEIVSTLFTYVSLALVRGESVRIKVSDSCGDLLKVEIEGRRIPGLPDELVSRDFIEIVNAFSTAQQSEREKVFENLQSVVEKNDPKPEADDQPQESLIILPSHLRK